MSTNDGNAKGAANVAGHARIKQKPKAKGHGGTVESRIAHIEGLMRTLTFRTGTTAKLLALKWGLSLATVEKDTAEASRRVRASVIGDREHIGASVGAALETALQNAVAEKQWRVVAQLADTWAKIAGVVAPVRTEVTAMLGTTATPAEARKVMRELFPGAVGPEADPAGAPDVGGPPPGTATE
jgi:hypothetical protein